jgi:hypothetical protein
MMERYDSDISFRDADAEARVSPESDYEMLHVAGAAQRCGSSRRSSVRRVMLRHARATCQLTSHTAALSPPGHTTDENIFIYSVSR